MACNRPPRTPTGLASKLDSDRLDGYLRLERLIWECVNQERYRLYQSAWKSFYQAWEAEPDFCWPVQETFAQQHQRLVAAARRLGLTPDPIGLVSREGLLQKALQRAAIKAQTTLDKLVALQPPLQELLP